MQENTPETEMTSHTPAPERRSYYMQSPSSEERHHEENTNVSDHSSPSMSEILGGYYVDHGYLRSLGRFLLCTVAVFFSLYLLLSCILYSVSKHQKPVITMKSITFDQFSVSLGSDIAGQETYMASVNSTVKFTYRNTATLFWVRVTMSEPLNLNYLELTLATGNMNDFDQSKKSQRTVAVEVSGDQIPMYGAGASFISYGGKPVPLNLVFAVYSRAHVWVSLFDLQFDRIIYCSVIFDPKKLKVPLSLHNCTHK